MKMFTKEHAMQDAKNGRNPPAASWILGYKKTDAGDIPIVSTRLILRDHADNICARMTNFRNNYRIDPGLYAAGIPDQS